jgi:hypothetical protein
VTTRCASATRDGTIKRPETFLVEAITSIKHTCFRAMEDNVRLNQPDDMLGQSQILRAQETGT